MRRAPGSLTFYVKNTADGYISESITLTYKIDKTNPTGEIRIDQRNAWQSFWNTISFDLFYKSRQTVTLTAADEASGVTAIEYLLSEEDYTAAQLDGMTFRPYTAPVATPPTAGSSPMHGSPMRRATSPICGPTAWC